MRRHMRNTAAGTKTKALWIGYTKDGREIYQAVAGWEPEFPYTFDENRNWVVAKGEPNEATGTKKPINIRVDPGLLARIDAAAYHMRRTRTEIIEEGAMRLVSDWERMYNKGAPFEGAPVDPPAK